MPRCKSHSRRLWIEPLEDRLLLAAWSGQHGDLGNTGRANFAVPAARLNDTFFDVFRWQTRLPGSPLDGSFSGTSMSFYDGAGPGGADIVIGGYHWPKGVQGMDRHTGHVFWSGNPEGGESIGSNTAAFSNDGSVIYVTNDATSHPLMAFSTATGPDAYWHNGGDANPDLAGAFSPKVAPDGRIFVHPWNDRPYGFTDSGSQLTNTWSAQTPLDETYTDLALYMDAGTLRVVASGRGGQIKSFNGTTGAEVWSVSTSVGTDADVTVDPATGKIYVPMGFDDVSIAGLDKNGNPLWGTSTKQVFDWVDGTNNPQRAQSGGALSHDGATFYFQTQSIEGDGRLYAINTSNGTVKWSFATHSQGGESDSSSSPIVTTNGVIIIGNNLGDTYYAIQDTGSQGVLLDTLTVDSAGTATASATISPDGLLYLPLRTTQTVAGGSQSPSLQVENLFAAIDINAEPLVILPGPGGQTTTALNNAVRINWNPINDPGNHFGHYAIYRSTSSFSTVAGMTPLTTISDISAMTYLDSSAVNGTSYYYAVTTVTNSGGEATSVTAIGPATPFESGPTDLDVTYIGRTPRYNYNAVKNNPVPGDVVSFEAHVRNWGSSVVAAAGYHWEIDGIQVAQGTINSFLAGEERIMSLPWVWQGGPHRVKFVVDPQNLITESTELNNSIEDRTDGISVGFWVEQSVYDYFQAHQRDLGIGANSWEDWAQRQMARWNQYSAEAVYEISPLGILDRVRIDKIIVVPNGTLPPGNIPDASDRTVDLVWPFGAGLITNGFYSDTTTVSDGNPFYFEGSLIHELGHARYLIDNYSFDVHNTATTTMVQIMEQGQPVGGSPLMPFLAFNEVLYYNREGGIMTGPYRGWSPYEAAALNLIAGKRASQGNYNAPGNIGVFLNDLPASNRIRFITESGTVAAGASVTVFRSAPTPGLYGKVFDNTPDAQYTTDANGEILLPRNPFFDGGGPTSIWEPPMMALRIEYAGKRWFQFVEITEFNLEYWRGHTALGQYVIELPGPGNSRVSQDIALEAHDRPITRGATATNAANGTDFGPGHVGTPGVPQMFVIKNDGSQLLSLTGSTRVVVSGSASADFVVTAQPDTNIGGGGLVTFRVQFTPSATGVRQATLTIASNDPDEPSFSFAIQGTGYLAGDYGISGTVDASDYVLWRKSLARTVPASSGADGDGDGTIDQDDYAVWRAHFGQTAPASATDAALLAVIDEGFEAREMTSPVGTSSPRGIDLSSVDRRPAWQESVVNRPRASVARRSVASSLSNSLLLLLANEQADDLPSKEFAESRDSQTEAVSFEDLDSDSLFDEKFSSFSAE